MSQPRLCHNETPEGALQAESLSDEGPQGGSALPGLSHTDTRPPRPGCSSEPTVPRSLPPDPHQTLLPEPLRPSSGSRLSAQGQPQAWELGTLLPWSWPFSLWASLLSPTAPLWLRALGSLLMSCAPTGRGRPTLARPREAPGALAADPGGPAPAGSKGPHSHSCPWHYRSSSEAGHSRQEVERCLPRTGERGHWGVTA